MMLFSDDEAEYISSDEERDEAPPPDSIFHQTSLHRQRRSSRNGERTIYTPPSTLSVTPDPSADEISGSVIQTTPLTSQRSPALDTSQTWDDMDGFEDLVNESNDSKEMDNSAISAVSHQTDITQSEVRKSALESLLAFCISLLTTMTMTSGKTMDSMTSLVLSANSKKRPK